jgi:hypothetical protein
VRFFAAKETTKNFQIKRKIFCRQRETKHNTPLFFALIAAAAEEGVIFSPGGKI